jgi:hypothetical protein
MAGAPAAGKAGPFGNPAHDADYYFKCMIGGIFSCGLTHLAVTPLDVIKCRMQVRRAAAAIRSGKRGAAVGRARPPPQSGSDLVSARAL